jgi:hypothetical protein
VAFAFQIGHHHQNIARTDWSTSLALWPPAAILLNALRALSRFGGELFNQRNPALALVTIPVKGCLIVPDRGRIYAMGRDITELKEAENKLRETRRELALVGRRTTLAAMSAAIAHEISWRTASNCPGALMTGALFCQTPMPELGRDRQGRWRIQKRLINRGEGSPGFYGC